MAVCVSCGLYVDESGLLAVKLRPGGGISCDPDGADAGLHLTTAPASGTSCIDVAGGAVSINLSEDDCNGLTCRGDGLYAHCPDSIVGNVEVGHTGGVLPIALNATHDIVSLCTVTPTSDCVAGGGTEQVRVCNTLCCTVGGLVTSQAYGGEITDESAGFAANVTFDVSVNGGAYGTAPITTWNIYNDGALGRRHHLPFVPDVNFHTLAPDECVSFSGRVRIVVTAGTAVWANVPRFAFAWQFTQTGCC